MPGWIGILIFVVAVLVIIFFHELGHFLTAKWFKIKVEEFFIGFGPRVWSFRRGETEYGIKAIPAGGYVRIAGMNPFEESAPEEMPRTFGAKPAWQRAIVILAGSAIHFILAFLLVFSYFTVLGQPTRFGAEVSAVEPRLEGSVSPAAAAGLEPGDRFLEVDGRTVQDYDEFVDYTRSRPGREITLVVERDGRRVVLRATPVLSEIEGEEVGRLGVILARGEILERERLGPLAAGGRAGALIGEVTVASLQGIGRVFGPEGLGRIVGQIFEGRERQLDDPAGLVGAARLSGQAAAAGAFDELLFLFVAFNIFVGLLNVLPLPPLDGGHLAVIVFEKVTGRRVDPRKLVPLTTAVVAFLLVFFVALLYLDILRPLPNPFR